MNRGAGPRVLRTAHSIRTRLYPERNGVRRVFGMLIMMLRFFYRGQTNEGRNGGVPTL